MIYNNSYKCYPYTKGPGGRVDGWKGLCDEEREGGLTNGSL